MSPSIPLPAASPGKIDSRIAAYANASRASAGKSQLPRDPCLDALALEHARDSAARGGQTGHSGFQSRFDRAHQGVGAVMFAENVHCLPTGGTDPARLFVEQWMASRVHRTNLLGPWNRTGVGVANDSAGRTFAVQVFASVP